MNYNNNNIRNQNNNININEYMIHNNISDSSYDDSKINFSLTNNSTNDTMSNKYNMNSDYNNNIIYQNNNMIFYNNNKIQRNKPFINNQNQYMRNKNVYNNNIYNHINNYNNQKYYRHNNNIIDNYNESNLNNKFNTNNPFDNINNFYSINNKNFIPKMNNYQINNSIYKNNININQIINNNKKEVYFNKLNLNIKLGEKDIVKEIIIDIDNDDISEIVNHIIKKYNFNENYFEPLLNIIEKAVNVLINFDKIKPSKYAIKNLEENKNLLNENINDIDDSLILDLIEKKNYKEYFNNIFYDIYGIKLKQERNFSCPYKYRNHKNIYK